MPSSLLTPVTELTREEYAIVVLDEIGSVDGRNWTQHLTEAYEGREHDRRCCCCGAYVSHTLTGSYDSGTCLDCGTAQEASEEEYERVTSERRAKLVKHYTTGRGGNYSSRARKITREMVWVPEGNIATVPTFAVRMARRELVG